MLKLICSIFTAYVNGNAAGEVWVLRVILERAS